MTHRGVSRGACSVLALLATRDPASAAEAPRLLL
eukprot:CAMPEP_0204264454 /NCGR_PEP_ID=MMETSP0468-20130131/9028_1 /ASSEMBLY_ACC=CAM_ASM_000383 /TAXON_ID=2969 /ORGANISM="Oxyrrhis marina" /LENGTH=33 /DNA_ID= /DNA_START= /DNA_END= /DNA_ORIENTATION=